MFTPDAAEGVAILVVGAVGMWLALQKTDTITPQVIYLPARNKEQVLIAYTAICSLMDELGTDISPEAMKRLKAKVMKLAQNTNDADVLINTRRAIRLFEEGNEKCLGAKVSESPLREYEYDHWRAYYMHLIQLQIDKILEKGR